MPDEVVCDSSVAVRWFQDGHDAARRLLDRALAGELMLWAPSVILWETGNVLLKRGVRADTLLERQLTVVTADVHFARAVAGRVSTDVLAGVGLST